MAPPPFDSPHAPARHNAFWPDEPGVLFVSTGFGRIDQSEPMAQRIAGMFRSDDHGKTWRF